MLELKIVHNPENPDNAKNIQAAINFLRQLIDPGQEAEKPAKKPAEKPAEKPAKKEAEKPAKKEAKEPAKKEAEKPAGGAALSIDAVRTTLAEKVGAHRDEIKAKLTELGAKNVTTLEEEKYAEFVAYLKSLD